MDLTLNINDPNRKPFVAENIMEEDYTNPDRLDEESIGNIEGVAKNPAKFNEKIE